MTTGLFCANIPYPEKLLAMSRVWQSKDGKDYRHRSQRGAGIHRRSMPCHKAQELAEMETDIEKMAEQGLRVIGVAKATFKTGQLPSRTQHDFNFEMVGLLGIADPVRPGVPEAVKECYDAGIRVIMITGDYPTTPAVSQNKLA